MMHQILDPEVAVFKSICFSTNKHPTKINENRHIYKEQLIYNRSPIAKNEFSYTRKDLVDACEKKGTYDNCILQAFSSSQVGHP